MDFRVLLLILVPVLFSACSLTKGLPEGQKIYKETIIDFSAPELPNQRQLKEQLSARSILQPVRGLEKIRVNIYNNNNKEGKKKGIAYLFQTKIGKPPVIYIPKLVEASRLRMEKYLIDHGYFQSNVKADTILSDRKVAVRYTVSSAPRYKINQFQHQFDSLIQHEELNKITADAQPRVGAYYNKVLLEKQRKQQAVKMNDLGYYKVNEGNFYFILDTTHTTQKVNIDNHFVFQDSTEVKKFYFGNTLVYPNFSLTQSSESAPQIYDNISIIQKETFLKPAFINTLIWDDAGKLYSKTEERKMLRRFLATNLFKFVNLEYQEWSTMDSLHLDRYLYLTPKKMRNVNLDIELHNSSGNIFGSQVGGQFTHFNLFKGAEKLRVSASVNGEFQAKAQEEKGLFNTLDYLVQVEYGLPGVRLPFRKLKKIKNDQLPRTQFSISNKLQRRVNFYFLNSATAAFGYVWNQKKNQHSITPLSYNYVNLISGSERLDTILDTNNRLKASFENLIILSLKYEYKFAKQSSSKSNGAYSFSIKTGLESAGNVASLLASKGGQNGMKKLFGIPYAQFVKFDLDFRPQFKFRRGTVASRIIIGLGRPYGNSSVLPYTKQYIVGGSGSMRAFDIRTLGPGSFQTNIQDAGNNFIDQTGDIRLETNFEYRFPIFSLLKGAAFLDIGNIWLANKNAGDNDPEATVFQFNNFYKQLGIGTGLGLRLDFELAVLRLDFALPVHDPRLEKSWVVRKWQFSDIKMRIGVGYPF